MTTWTEELKKQVIDSYLAAEPTADNTTEIIKDIADEIEQSPNGVRMILITAGVYVKKDAAAPAATKTTASGEKKTGGTRVSKESSIADLRAAIEAKGAEVDEDILGKLTGKAAIYFLSVLKA